MPIKPTFQNRTDDADIAEAALLEYGSIRYGGILYDPRNDTEAAEGLLENLVSDLLCFCQRGEIDFDEMIRRGRRRFENNGYAPDGQRHWQPE